MKILNVVSELTNNLSKTYSVYSKFQVACLLKFSDGSFFNGQNIENSSFGATLCAERVALSNAFANGMDLKQISEIHLMSSSDECIPMCGICIQTLSEFVNPEADVYLYNKGAVENMRFKFKDFMTYSHNLKGFKL